MAVTRGRGGIRVRVWVRLADGCDKGVGGYMRGLYVRRWLGGGHGSDRHRWLTG